MASGLDSVIRGYIVYSKAKWGAVRRSLVVFGAHPKAHVKLKNAAHLREAHIMFAGNVPYLVNLAGGKVDVNGSFVPESTPKQLAHGDRFTVGTTTFIWTTKNPAIHSVPPRRVPIMVPPESCTAQDSDTNLQSSELSNAQSEHIKHDNETSTMASPTTPKWTSKTRVPLPQATKLAARALSRILTPTRLRSTKHNSIEPDERAVGHFAERKQNWRDTKYLARQSEQLLKAFEHRRRAPRV